MIREFNKSSFHNNAVKRAKDGHPDLKTSYAA